MSFEASLLKAPNGQWFFAGSVDVRLAYTHKDGSLITNVKQANRLAQRISKPSLLFKMRTFDSVDSALSAARDLGQPVHYVEKDHIHDILDKASE